MVPSPRRNIFLHKPLSVGMRHSGIAVSACCLWVLFPQLNWRETFVFIDLSFPLSRGRCPWWGIPVRSLSWKHSHKGWSQLADPEIPDTVRLLEICQCLGQTHSSVWVSADDMRIRITIFIFAVVKYCSSYDLSLYLQVSSKISYTFSTEKMWKIKEAFKTNWASLWDFSFTINLSDAVASPVAWPRPAYGSGACDVLLLCFLHSCSRQSFVGLKWQLSDSPLQLILCSFPCHLC